MVVALESSGRGLGAGDEEGRDSTQNQAERMEDACVAGLHSAAYAGERGGMVRLGRSKLRVWSPLGPMGGEGSFWTWW